MMATHLERINRRKNNAEQSCSYAGKNSLEPFRKVLEVRVRGEKSQYSSVSSSVAEARDRAFRTSVKTT